jgi:hypothetical protein
MERECDLRVTSALPRKDGRAMDKPKRRSTPDTVPDEGRPARNGTEIQPVKRNDVVLETYEQSPERLGGDERNHEATPGGPLPDRECATPD